MWRLTKQTQRSEKPFLTVNVYSCRRCGSLRSTHRAVLLTAEIEATHTNNKNMDFYIILIESVHYLI